MDSSPLVSSDSSWRLQFFQLWVIRVWNLLPCGVTSPSRLNGFRQSALPAIRSLKVPSNVHRLSPLTGTLPVLQESLSSLGVFILSSKCTELAHEEITFIEELCIKWKILHNSLSELNGTCSTPILIYHPI